MLVLVSPWPFVAAFVGMAIAVVLKRSVVPHLSGGLICVMVVGILVAGTVIGQYFGYLVVIDMVGSDAMRDPTRASGLNVLSEAIICAVDLGFVFLTSYAFLYARGRNVNVA